MSSATTLQTVKYSSPWHVIKEKRESERTKQPDGSPDTYEATFLRRDDGTTFERIGLGRPQEFGETFLLKGNFGELRFEACRWDPHKGITDTYRVNLYSLRNRKTEETLARSMAKDIESALINLPIHVVFNGIPVRNVVFQLNRGYSADTDLRAEEV